MSNIPSPGQIYRHFKGKLYRIVTMAKHSETGEMLVIYQALYGEYQVYARELSLFLGEVDGEKHPQAAGKPRFELQKELIAAFDSGICAAGDSAAENFADSSQTAESTGQEELTGDRQQDKEDELQTGPEQVPGLEMNAEPEPDNAETGEQQEELNIDPLVLDFLDARSYRERLRILSALHPRITDDMINVMAISVDVEIEDGDTEKRFEELRTCLLTFERYESKSSRLRQI